MNLDTDLPCLLQNIIMNEGQPKSRWQAIFCFVIFTFIFTKNKCNFLLDSPFSFNECCYLKIILDTNPSIKKIVDVTRFPEDISMLVVTMLNRQEWKKMCLNFVTVYTFNIELFICKRNCSQKPLTKTWIFNVNVV